MFTRSRIRIFLFLFTVQLGCAGILEMAPRLRNGDIVFIVSDSRQFRAIQKVTKSKWTHMGMAFKFKAKQPNKRSKIIPENEDGFWSVLEASQPVGLTELETFTGKAPSKLNVSSPESILMGPKIFSPPGKFISAKTTTDFLRITVVTAAD